MHPTHCFICAQVLWGKGGLWLGPDVRGVHEWREDARRGTGSDDRGSFHPKEPILANRASLGTTVYLRGDRARRRAAST